MKESRFTKKSNRRNEILRGFSLQKGINKVVNRQLFVLSVIGLFCNLFTWFFWMRFSATGSTVQTLQWYVVYPFVFQVLSVAVLEIVRVCLEKGEEKTGKSNYIVAAIIGAVLYSVFFLSLVYFYKEIPVFWLFAICPLLLCSLYSDIKWMCSALLSTLFLLICVIIDIFSPYRMTVSNPSGTMMILEAVIIAALVGLFAITIHSKIILTINEVANAEATRQAKDAFFTKMSHEIRTPVNAVLGMNEMILREEISPEVEEYATNIKKAGQNLLTLINDVLDSSKLEAGKLELISEEYDLLNVLNDCYNMLKFRAEEKGLELKVVCDPSLPRMLCGDEVRIRQIITNLLSNAVKFTNVGHVEFNVGWKKTEGNNMTLLVTIKDTGVGIPEENLKKLFVPFERLDDRKNNYVEGAGLGLSITKQLIDLMKGSIEVESVVSEGSVFRVSVPQGIAGETSLGDFTKAVESLSNNNEQYKEKFVAPDARALVVDDVQMNIDVFKGLLKKTQIQIDTALSGERALKLLQSTKYDIVFMDHLMPEMDGEETLHKFKKMDTVNAHTPIVALTANAGADAEQQYRKMGFDEYLSKPVKGKQLEEMIFKYLKDRKLKNSSESKEYEYREDLEVREGDFVERLDFLDTEAGLSYCGDDKDLYLEVLNSFRKENRILELSKTFQEKDWKEYIVQAHALKSTALSIGAADLSSQAREMELAAKDCDYDRVEENHPQMMADYQKLLSKLNTVLE